MTSPSLKAQWHTFKKENPKVRIRDAAKHLQVSEAELLVTDLGESVTRLRPDWYDILMDLESLGEVMALTRNELFVHEKIGQYSNASVFKDHMMGQTLDKDIDLRIFFRNWHFAFAVAEEHHGEIKRSLQFFDKYGNAVHKTHLRPESNVASFDVIVEKYKHDDQSSAIEIEPLLPTKQELPDDRIDADALKEAWNSLKDTHDFIFLLRKFKVSRQQAFRIAGLEYARLVPTSSLQHILEKASEAQLNIMIFVNNPGCVQIHSGIVNRLKLIEDWYNILDPRFNLHVRYKEIATAWLVTKPVENGTVTSLELFDEAGQALCYVFSKRKEGEIESEVWRKILSTIS